MKVKKPLLPWQKNAVNELSSIVDIEGKRILEIGGNSFAVGDEFLKRGAKKVDIINIQEGLSYHSDQISFVSMDARDLTFENETFDIVFGVAVLEHLQNLDKVLIQIDSVLKKNGKAFLQGGPLWSSIRGHHVWVHCDGVKYEFSNEKNPVPDWGHLFLNKDEMRTYLVSNSIIESHANEIVEWVYEDTSLNRYTFEDYKRFFNECPLDIESFVEKNWGKPSIDITNKLVESGNPSKCNYHTGAIEVVLNKI